jgi:cell wall-associated NlpC family hydrolase
MVKLAVLLLALLAGGCASTLATPQPFPVPTDPPASPPGAAPDAIAPLSALARTGYAIAGTALALRGTPYRDGGSDPDSGFDCSGFVQYVFARHGVALPRSVAEQYRAGRPVGAGPLDSGDLVFFATVAAAPSHVGIAIGGDEFVHAPSASGQVRVERLSAGYWSSRFVGAKRMN